MFQKHYRDTKSIGFLLIVHFDPKNRNSRKTVKHGPWLFYEFVFDSLIDFIFKPLFNPYLRHFGNVPRRHLWTKNPNWPDDVTHVRKIFTAYYFETTGVPLHPRHSNVSRDVIVGELLRNKENFSRKPENWVSVICGQKIHGKYLYWVLIFLEEKLVWEVS